MRDTEHKQRYIGARQKVDKAINELISATREYCVAERAVTVQTETALAEIWKVLGAKNQTEAMETLRSWHEGCGRPDQ